MGEGQEPNADTIRSIDAPTLAGMKRWVRLAVGVSISTLVVVAFAALWAGPPASAAVASAPGSRAAPTPGPHCPISGTQCSPGHPSPAPSVVLALEVLLVLGLVIVPLSRPGLVRRRNRNTQTPADRAPALLFRPPRRLAVAWV